MQAIPSAPAPVYPPLALCGFHHDDDRMTDQQEPRLSLDRRYAIYWAPPAESLLAVIGAAWLGEDPAEAPVRQRPAVSGFSNERLMEITATARLYGLHATLKPPFRLAADTHVDDLRAACRLTASQMPAIIMPLLRLALLDGFFALVPSAPCPALDDLAASCVREFDCFRRPAMAAELARRRAGGLTFRQEELLLRWGYPYVLDCFRFHVTLTDRLHQAEAERLRPILAEIFAPAVVTPVVTEAITLFIQEQPGGCFRQIEHFPLMGPSRSS
jgi:putative phosphonate metabolism protein